MKINLTLRINQNKGATSSYESLINNKVIQDDKKQKRRIKYKVVKQGLFEKQYTFKNLQGNIIYSINVDHKAASLIKDKNNSITLSIQPGQFILLSTNWHLINMLDMKSFKGIQLFKDQSPFHIEYKLKCDQFEYTFEKLSLWGSDWNVHCNNKLILKYCYNLDHTINLIQYRHICYDMLELVLLALCFVLTDYERRR